jgi:hypothetical protein
MTMARHRCRSAALGAALATTLGALPTLYAWAVRSMLRRNLGRLWAGDPGPLLDSYADNVHFVFPGAPHGRPTSGAGTRSSGGFGGSCESA